ncbi:hypothetical protein XENORESO_018398 [Xenotaenia resolanae]|uniref:Uncharacterized protein n=1 Tax=Xenotaenia resolanae TaxID=208358 RepID=A0ABV0XAG7_9TELE
MVFLSGPPAAALINMEALFLLDLILTHIRVSKLKVALLLTNKLIPSSTKADRAVSVHQSHLFLSAVESAQVRRHWTCSSYLPELPADLPACTEKAKQTIQLFSGASVIQIS